MKSLVRTTLAAVVAGVALAGCATYDYGYAPYNGYSYGYDTGGYSYGYGPYYYGYGPSYYVAPSVGLGFTYHDYDRGNYDRHHDRNYDRSYDRNYDRDRNDYRRSDNDQRRNDINQARPMTPPGREDPWGGSNIPFGRNSQQ